MESIRKKLKGEKHKAGTCQCQCSSVCLISGDDEIKEGKSKNYTLTKSLAKNKDCDNCTHESTEWRAYGTSMQFVELSNKTKTRVKVKIQNNAPPRDFYIGAIAKYKCKCKDDDSIEIDCKHQENSLRILITN